LNIKDTVDYARLLAVNSGRAHRFVMSELDSYYYIERADVTGEFEALEGMFGRQVDVADSVLQIELDGFVNLGSSSYLEFTPSDFDNDAEICLYGRNKYRTIRITGRESRMFDE
jgi:hypothetical protein